jgi:hypothetical protein
VVELFGARILVGAEAASNREASRDEFPEAEVYITVEFRGGKIQGLPYVLAEELVLRILKSVLV